MPNGILTQSFATFKCITYRRHSTSDIWWNESTKRSNLSIAALSNPTQKLKLSFNHQTNTNKTVVLPRGFVFLAYEVARLTFINPGASLWIT
jgi:hypothetical protein